MADVKNANFGDIVEIIKKTRRQPGIEINLPDLATTFADFQKALAKI